MSDVLILPQITPVRRAMPGLPLDKRKRLAEALATSASIPQAAATFGCSREQLITLATKEGFQGLLKDLRHPLLVAMQDAAKRDMLLQMIREAVPATEIGRRFGVTGSAVWNYFYRTGLDHPYMEARKKFQHRRRLSMSPSPNLNPAIAERLCIAAMLASRGVTVSASPRRQAGRIYNISLLANDHPVRLLYTRSAAVERTYYRINPTIQDAWYAVITDRRHLIVFAPPHDGRVRYIPIGDPCQMLDGREPPWALWKPTEWIQPPQLGIAPRKRKRTKRAS